MKETSLQHGYSLIELLIYISLFVLISIILINALITLMKTQATTQAYRTLQHNGELAMERMVREVRNASHTGGGSVYATDPGTLVLSGLDASSTARTVTFSAANNALQINDNGATGFLTTGEVSVASLVFHSITTSAGEAVKITLELATTAGLPKSASFYSTVVVRGI